MKVNHYINNEMFNLMKKLDEANFFYRTYIHNDMIGNFGILLGDFDGVWFIDIVEYLIPSTGADATHIATGLSIMMMDDGAEEFRDVENADEAMEVIREFFEK